MRTHSFTAAAATPIGVEMPSTKTTTAASIATPSTKTAEMPKKSDHFWHLCCHHMTDTDDLILQQERQRVANYTTPNPPQWWMAALLDLALGFSLYKKPFCCRQNNVTANAIFGFFWLLCQIAVLVGFLFEFRKGVFSKLVCSDEPSEFGAKMYRCEYSRILLVNTSATDVQAEIKALSVDSSIEEYWKQEGTSGVNSSVAVYLEWKAETISFVPPLFNVLLQITSALSLASIFLTFSLTFQPTDPDEILFPAVLMKKKDTRELHVEPTPPEIASEPALEQKVSSKYHLVRTRQQVLELGGLMYFLTIIFIAIVAANGKTATMEKLGGLERVILQFILFPGITFVATTSIIGALVQIHNATILANVFIDEIIQPRRTQQFREWMEIYKTTVGALHIWSWRSTWMVGGLLSFFSISIMADIVDVVFLYSTFMDPTLKTMLSESEKFNFFYRAATNEMTAIMIHTVLVTGIMGFLAMVSVRYKRLRVLVATTMLNQCQLDDFEILHSDHAAYTLFDTPITTRSVVLALKFIGLQVGLLALSATAA